MKLPHVPKIICDALEDYATHVSQEDSGHGESALKAEKQWEITKAKLIKWAMNQKTDKKQTHSIISNSFTSCYK